MNENTFICQVVKVIASSDLDGCYKLVLNKGSVDGIEKNFRFLIYEIAEEIIDPATNASLGNLEIVKGTGKVTHLQEKMCTIESDMYDRSNRTTTRVRNPFLGSLGTKEETVYNTPEHIPFDSPTIGDCAKQIP